LETDTDIEAEAAELFADAAGSRLAFWAAGGLVWTTDALISVG
jgi:hypothetical protein